MTLVARALALLARVIKDDQILAWLLSIANNDAFPRQGPIIGNANVCDCFASVAIKAVVINDAFTKQLHLAVFVVYEIVSQVVS